MTSPTDVCNRALSEIGARTIISDLNEVSPAGVQCKLQYDTMRQQLLRAAPWGFARKTVVLSTLGLATDTPPAAPYPWLAKYLYPTDCLKMRYILPPPIPPIDPTTVPDVSVQNLFAVPWCMPSREWRYLVSLDDTVSPARRVIVANIIQALAVYTANVTDPDLFDPLFENALVMALANKLVIPLSGNVAMKASYAQLAQAAITDARVADGNEAVPSTDHTPDWIAGRFAGGYPFTGTQSLGDWYGGWDNIAWGM